jgi:hypothetical protein
MESWLAVTTILRATTSEILGLARALLEGNAEHIAACHTPQRV